MDENELTKYLPIGQFEKRYEYVSQECVRVEGILKDLGLLGLANEALENAEPRSTNKDNADWKTQGLISELKTSIETYEILNATLCESIKIAEREVARGEAMLKEHHVPEEEIPTLKEKIQRYEKHLKRLDEQHLWLQEPQFSSDYVLEQMKLLKQLEMERNSLQGDIDTFGGLKPDITEAKQQLNAIKREHQMLVKQISKSDE